MGFPSGSADKESACDAEDLSSVPGLGRPLGEGSSYPLQYSSLENSMGCIVHRVAELDMIDFYSLEGRQPPRHLVFLLPLAVLW